MKKLILFLCLIAFGMSAQTGTGTKTTFKIGVVPEGTGIDSILVHGNSDKIVKKIAKSSLIGDFLNDGATTMAPSQNAVYDALLNKVSKTGNESITGTKTFTDRVSIIGANAGLNSNAISPFNIVGGNGGNSTATTGFAVAGNASEIKIQGGNGGNALSSSGTNLGGTAGAVYFVGGDGGLALGGSANLPGNGGNATLQGGDSWGGVPGFASLKGGNNKVAGSYGGNVYIVPGWGNDSDVDDSYNGTIFLGLSPNAVSLRGNTVVGGLIDDKQNRLQVNGSTRSDKGFNSYFSTGHLLSASVYSGNNRQFQFVSSGDGEDIPLSHSVEITAQPDFPITLRRTTGLGNNFLELDDYTVMATNTAVEISSAGGLANMYLDSSGVGISTNGFNKTYIKTDNLTTDRSIQVPNANGTIALSENTVNLTGNQTVTGNKTFSNVLTLANSTLRVDDEEANFNITNLRNKVLFEFAGNPVYQLAFSSSALTANRVLNFIDASGSPAIVRTTAPTSSTAAGVKGEIYVDATGFYYCYATNLWHKVTGSTF